MVRLGPALLAPALTQGSLDPQMLFHTGAPDDGRFDGITLGVHQYPIQDQTQQLMTQRRRLLIPAGAEISQKGILRTFGDGGAERSWECFPASASQAPIGAANARYSRFPDRPPALEG